MEHRFIVILAAEWRGVLDRKWNSKISLVFFHVVLTNNLRPHKAREFLARIDHQLDLWERVIHTGLVGDALAEVTARKRPH